MKNYKRETTEGIELQNQESLGILEKENCFILGNIESRHRQTSRNERKSKKSVPQKNKKAARNQALEQKSHQRNKHLSSLPCKILLTILKMVKGGTQTNWPKNKQIDDGVQLLTLERWYRLYEPRRQGGRRSANIEDNVNAALRGQ